jgi:hypothetical protein
MFRWGIKLYRTRVLYNLFSVLTGSISCNRATTILSALVQSQKFSFALVWFDRKPELGGNAELQWMNLLLVYHTHH